MPKLERLEWVAHLSEGRGVTLTDEPAADRLLAESPAALLLGVLFDSQYPTRRAFAVPLRLQERLGHLDLFRLASEAEEEALIEVFARKPALHRFPGKFARLTRQVAVVLVEQYEGDASRLWLESGDVEELARRVRSLPAFGPDKTQWTVGMLGRMGVLPFAGWEEYRVTR